MLSRLPIYPRVWSEVSWSTLLPPTSQAQTVKAAVLVREERPLGEKIPPPGGVCSGLLQEEYFLS